MDLGEKIRLARSQQGMTQKELAQKAGLTERTIQRIENHDVEPSVYSINKISLVLDFDFKQEKKRIMKRRNAILYAILAIWTAALVGNILYTSFDFKDRWWELLMWLIILVSVLTRQIYIPYYKRR